MAKALLNDSIQAESETTEVVEGNIYFPRESVDMSRLEESSTQYTCPWKGKATYYNHVDGDEVIDDVAWSYPQPKAAARNIAGHLTFDSGKGIKVESG